jgi:DNA topoisomerase I
MGQSLVIVESPTKARTITKFLGKDFRVTSCMGHVRDLPEKELGVDVENGFVPDYQIMSGKQKVVKELRDLGKNVDSVFLATDPDREGEAIAWHVAQVMKLDMAKTHRISFHEITRDAIAAAIQSPGSIDMQKVDAQQARRVLDRLVGYQVSPLLWKTVRKGLSAGRVQSVAVRLICEREEEIDKFEPQEYWSIAAQLASGEINFEADLWKIDGKQKKIRDEKTARETVEEMSQQEYSIANIEKKRQKRKPAPPFITSTLQQEASRKLRMTPQITMRVAQQLYEGIEIDGEATGLITYMRTDSTNVAQEAVSSVRDHIASRYGSEYVPSRPNKYKSASSAQEAHEAVRPTAVARTPESLEDQLTRDQIRLYRLIWRRFVASQMKPQELDVTTLTVEGGRFLLRSQLSVVAFDGYTRIYAEGKDDESEEEVEHSIPPALLVAWEKNGGPGGDPLFEGYRAEEIDPKQNFTKPPSRFSEATIIRELEARGIGRPSTYHAIIGTIQTRKYVEKHASRLAPTDLGKVVNRILVEQFPKLFNAEFTAEMESELDKIEHGNDHWKDMLTEFYGDFQTTLEAAMSRRAEIKKSTIEETDKVCTECGKPMLIRFGSRGKFYGCSGFPECKNTEPLESEKMPPPEPFPGVECPECGAGMEKRQGPFGEYLTCEKHPDCKGKRSIPTGVKCPKPECEGELVVRTSRRGKKFYGCDQYPECDVVYWDRPVSLAEADPESGLMFQLEKVARSGETRMISAQYPPPALRPRAGDKKDGKKASTSTAAKKPRKKAKGTRKST